MSTMRWTRTSQDVRVALTVPTAPVFGEVCRYWYAPRTLRVDDSAFDRTWKVFGAPEASWKALLTPALRAEIAACKLDYFKIDDNEIVVSCTRSRQDEAKMTALAEHLAGALARVPAPTDPGELDAARAALQREYRRKIWRFIICVAIGIALVVLLDRL
jgi:hypothetical protein